MRNLLGLSEQELVSLAREVGEPDFRGRQMYQSLYSKGVSSIEEMTSLSRDFRAVLSKYARIHGCSLSAKQISKLDGTTKFLFQLDDGSRVESVLIPPASSFVDTAKERADENKRLTVCVSTQVGCPLDCAFCATATMGYSRNLTAGEIVDQVLQVRRLTGKTITNVVFMGMGEPLLNYDNVAKAVELLSRGVKIAAKKITISTAGWADKIKQLADDRVKAKLAVSLHAANDSTRTKLMPLNKRFNLETLLSSLAHYYDRTKTRITYEYIFFDGVNDSERDLRQLIKLVRRVPSKVNIIPFHSISFTHPAGLAALLRPSPRLEQNVAMLRDNNITVMVRSNSGEDIDAACGQLAVTTPEAGTRRRPQRSIRKVTPAR